MIGRLSGILLEKQMPELLLDVSGIAYEVQVSMNTFSRLPEIGNKVVLHTHLVVREDAHHLFGFSELPERTLFRTLLKVNGIGAKSALGILSSIEPMDFVRCITAQDTAALQRLPGIGKKTAERLIIEMRDRLTDWQTALPDNVEKINSSSTTNRYIEQEAISALLALGFKPQEASRAVMKVITPEMNSAEVIRLALKGAA